MLTILRTIYPPAQVVRLMDVSGKTLRVCRMMDIFQSRLDIDGYEMCGEELHITLMDESGVSYSELPF
jgi:hypothetical protein